ncbi:MAG TPA: matrixin family metalloprotease [Lacipirellulaceae bacterium]|nr:matrixin family metalloprotease [Lacipirellulaceae bacterium]HMP05868.1 matrixin family metalloprotease [Lacipirellulaceae bacterium]
MNLRGSLCGALVLCGLTAGPATAYNLFGPYPWGTEGQTYYSKWGDYFAAGAPGGTITWSIMPDGTTVDPSFPDPNISGASSLESIMHALGYDEALAAIQRCFDRWEAAANIYFVQASDSGAPLNHSSAYPPNAGLIRLGAFPIANFGGGAVGYAPHPNGFSSLEGDILLNANSTFFLDPGAEGELISVFNDFESLIMHETAHAIGIDHTQWENQSVTSVNFDFFKYVNRELDPDDIAAVQILYGPALASDFDKNNFVDGDDLSAWAAGFGLATGAAKSAGDATGDGAVDGADFLQWQQELGGGALVGPQPQLHATPEPAARWLMVYLAAATLGVGRLGVQRRRTARRPAV